MRFDLDTVQTRLSDAVREFRARDGDLLRLGVHERTLVAKIACYVARRFRAYHVDVDYNRHALDPKRLERPAVAGLILPDLIVHRRGDDFSNLIVVEVKCEQNRQSRDRDRTKVLALMDEYAYSFGALLELPTGITSSARTEVWEWFGRAE
jgi:hypothetical protein